MFNLFKRKFADQWRCTACGGEGQYIHKDGYASKALKMNCTCEIGNARPLVPIDTKGREMSYKEWKNAVT